MQAQQTYSVTELTAQEVEAIMNGLNELPAKISRNVLNKIETQIIQQVQALQLQQVQQTQTEAEPEKKSK